MPVIFRPTLISSPRAARLVAALVLVALPALGALNKGSMLPYAAAAAPAPVDATPAVTEASGDVRIRNSAQGTAIYDNKRGISRISKDVVVTQVGEDFILNCDEITYNERNNEAVAKGHLRVESRDSTMTGDSLRADFDTRVITLQGHVVSHSYGKTDGARSTVAAGDFKHKPSQLQCDRIDYNYTNRQAVVSGHIRMTQEANSGSCDRILFDEARNVAHLQGNVVFRNAQNKRVIRSNDVVVWIDDNMVQANSRTTVTTPRDGPARPLAPRADLGAPPTLPDDILREFDKMAPPAPTPAPAPSAAPGSDDAPAKPNAG